MLIYITQKNNNYIKKPLKSIKLLQKTENFLKVSLWKKIISMTLNTFQFTLENVHYIYLLGALISEVAFGQIPIYLPERGYKSTFPQTLMLKTLDVSALAHFKGLMDKVMPSWNAFLCLLIWMYLFP